MQPAYITKSLIAASVNVIATSQTPLGAGNLTLVSSTVVLDTQRQVLITQAANETGHNFTLYGTNDSGAPISEVVAGSSGASVTSVLNYKTITRVAISAAATGAIQVGTNGVGATQWKILNTSVTPFNLGLAVIITGTVNFTVNYTYEDPNVPIVAGGQPTAFAVTALSAKSASTDGGALTTPVAAIQMVINSGTGSATLVAIQPGIAGP